MENLRNDLAKNLFDFSLDKTSSSFYSYLTNMLSSKCWYNKPNAVHLHKQAAVADNHKHQPTNLHQKLLLIASFAWFRSNQATRRKWPSRNNPKQLVTKSKSWRTARAADKLSQKQSYNFSPSAFLTVKTFCRWKTRKKVQQHKHLLFDGCLVFWVHFFFFPALCSSFSGENHDEHNVQHENTSSCICYAVLCSKATILDTWNQFRYFFGIFSSYWHLHSISFACKIGAFIMLDGNVDSDRQGDLGNMNMRLSG